MARKDLFFHEYYSVIFSINWGKWVGINQVTGNFQKNFNQIAVINAGLV